MTGSQSIDYEALQQEAMRSVVRAVLARTAKSGLPGDHHFYISFDTTAPGVGISKRLKEKYPSEMTIVLQHRFWDLLVGEDRFEVKLTFDGIPERLVVPFRALKVFIDPSVRFGLQFDEPDLELGGEGETQSPIDEDGRPRVPRAPRKPRQPKKSRTAEGAGSALDAATDISPNAAANRTPARVLTARPPGSAAAAPSEGAPKSKPDAPLNDGKSEGPDDKSAAPNGAQILSLDQFRKK